MNPLIHRKRKIILLLILLAVAYVAFSPKAEAVSPPPDGAYPGGNTAEGEKALFSLTTGDFNTAVGFLSLETNATGQFNTGVGAGTLALNRADENTAMGTGTLLFNTTGTANTADGAFALFHNTIGIQNTAIGASALFANTTGDNNTAIGVSALVNNTTGNTNTAYGFQALYNNTAANFNTAVGDLALYHNTTGMYNTAIGDGALSNSTTGVDNTGLGAGAGFNIVDASNVICIGSVDGANVSQSTWIGNVYGVATQNGTTAPVIISADGQLGTIASSERFKKDIATMENASEAILSLRPVTFHYKSDTKDTPQFGLIAEEVAKVDSALVLPDKEGKPYSVRYDQVNAMLLNEFLKEHRKVQELQKTVTEQQECFASRLAGQQKQIDALSATLQKVSTQLELSKAAPQTVLNNQ